jgi:predicted nucleic acid-binding Zn finger protein
MTDVSVNEMVLSRIEIKRLSKPELTQEDIIYFTEKYGKRFVRALRAVEEDKVVKYHFMPSDTATWIVRGHRREYLVIPETFCTGRDFYQSVVIAKDSTVCYHLLAQKIASIRGQYATIESTDSERRVLYERWRNTN